MIHRLLFSADGTWRASTAGHKENVAVVNSPQTIAALLFALRLPTKHKVRSSGPGRRVGISPRQRRQEGIWFLFVPGRRTKRRAAAAVQPSRMARFTSGCLFVWAGPGQQTRAFVAGRSGASAFPSLQFVPFFLLWQITKMENNRRVGPASLCDLDREPSPAFKKGLPDFSRGAKGLIFLGTAGPLMEFPSV